MKCSNIAFAIALLIVPCCYSLAKGADGAAATETTQQKINRSWGLIFADIPDVLRLHVPVLGQRETGLLISQVDRSMPGARLGLQAGDVILQANGSDVVQSADLPKTPSDTSLIVLRRGQVLPVPMHNPIQNAAAGFLADFPPQFAAPFAMPAMPGFAAGARGVSASSFSGGNESVSVSRSGDQLSIEMSLPELTNTPIRLRGSIGQIQQQLQGSQLPTAAKQRVMQAINQNR